jgi:uncharacterized protein (TIGR00290 family)
MIPAILSWSSGKDSAYALYRILQSHQYEIVGLLTTVAEDNERVAMHGVREELLDLQAEAIGLPLEKVKIPSPCSNEIYEAKMAESLLRWKANSVHHFVFGDLYLEDIRAYRERQLSRMGLHGFFPLWRSDTRALARSMIQDGFKAILSCVDLKKLPKDFAGRKYDHDLLAALPPQADPCGENGEFHSFVHAAPIYKKEIPVTVGEIVEREGFAFADILRRRDD